LDDPVDVRTREQALFRDYRARFGELPPISTKLLAPLGIVDNNSSESPRVFIYQTIAAAWNAERSMERTGAGGFWMMRGTQSGNLGRSGHYRTLRR
jgi:hypothetical protein